MRPLYTMIFAGTRHMVIAGDNAPSTYACAPWARAYRHDGKKVAGIGKPLTCLRCVAALLTE